VPTYAGRGLPGLGRAVHNAPVSTPAQETRLRAERKRRKLTVREVAEAVGTDSSNMSRLERGVQRPTQEVARALFKFFGGKVSLGDVYDPTFRFDNEAGA
jgi:transcriptional regulator with XRE-family HTH domain